MFMRFVTTRIDEDSHRPQGVFVAAYALLDSGELTREEWTEIREILNWFNKHLPHPPTRFVACRAIFWFKSGSKESINKIWDLVHLLRLHGRNVDVYKCKRLANICYEDTYQVAAYPSDRDGKTTIQ